MTLPEPGPSEAPNFGTPNQPRPAASVLLLRPRDGGGLEVLMLKRSPESHFMPDVWVFPGGALDSSDGEGIDGLKQCARRELVEEAQVTLPAETGLTTLSRWITPEVVKLRFDTWFFLAPVTADTVAEPDGFEMNEATWVSPDEALAAAREERMAIVFPTRRQLEALVGATSPEAAVAAAAANPEAERPVLPKVAGTKDDFQILTPGDPGYDEA